MGWDALEHECTGFGAVLTLKNDFAFEVNDQIFDLPIEKLLRMFHIVLVEWITVTN